MRFQVLLICLYFVVIVPVCTFAQVDTLRFREVKFEEIHKKYAPYFLPYKDSDYIKLPKTYLDLGYLQVFKGNDSVGNYLMQFAMDHYLEKNAELFHMISVQNTKNGNYSIAISNLDSAAYYNKKSYGYYGWVMLYYYRDYNRAISYLNIYDSLTPYFSDYPMGESLDYLKGLAYLNLNSYHEAINYFNKYIKEVSTKNDEKWVDYSAYYYKGICYEKLLDKKSALKNYKLAIKHNSKFVEALFHKNLHEKNEKKRKRNFLKVIKLIEQGYAKSDVYMEIFYPVYIQEVTREMNKLMN